MPMAGYHKPRGKYIVTGMEDNRNDLIVIVAGYPQLMESFLNSNPGFKSRFNKFFVFEDYNPEELYQIFLNFCNSSGYTISANLESYLINLFKEVLAKTKINFSNGRFVRNLFEKAITNQANRIASIENISDKEIQEIRIEDISTIVF